MMAFSSGLRVPTISAQRERERERKAGESERCREGGRVWALGSCRRNSACSGLEAKPWLWLCRPILLRFGGGQVRLNRWTPLLTRPGFMTLAISSRKEDLFRAEGVKP